MGRANLIVGALIVLLALGLAFPAVLKVRAAQQYFQCQNNLKRVGLGLLCYHGTEGSFPPGTTQNAALPLEERVSWFAAVMPYVEAKTPYWKLDETRAWSCPENERTLRGPYPVFLCPANPAQGDAASPGLTHYVGTAGIGSDAASLRPTDPSIGVFGYARRVRSKNLARGQSETVMVVETNLANGPWAAGGPPTVRGLDPNALPYFGEHGQFGSGHGWSGGPFSAPSTTNSLFTDGSVRPISSSLEPSVFEKMATIAGKVDLAPIED